ncbi:TolC family protein [Verrucomicrobiota bacterium]
MRLRIMVRSVMFCCIAGALGCASATRRTALPEPRSLGAEHLRSDKESPSAPDSTVGPLHERGGTLRLDHALAAALLHNPELEGFAYEVRAAEAREMQARALPNPELEIEIEEYNRDGEGFSSAETGISLGQLIELGGKRRWRTRVAQAEGRLAGWDYEAKRLDVFAETARRFAAVVAAQRRHVLSQSSIDVAERNAEAVQERVKAGKEPPFQAAKAGAELEIARMEGVAARHALAAARANLVAMWTAPAAEFGTAEDNLDAVLDVVPSLERLQSKLSSSPELERWEADIELRETALASEKAARVPDLEASVGVHRYEEDGTDSISFGIGLPLPVFDRNRGNTSAARHELEKARSEQRAAAASLKAQLAQAHADLASAHGRARALALKVVPATTEAFEAVREGYQQGKFGFLDMLDAQRGLFEAKASLIDSLEDYHGAATAIERITATGLATLAEEQKMEDER